MRKLYNLHYEQIAKENEKHYLDLHAWFSERGDKIPNGVEVVPTDWAIENGVVYSNENLCYLKVRNARSLHVILVLKEGQKYPKRYWSGFWKQAKKSRENKIKL
jgi:hypothetical protein